MMGNKNAYEAVWLNFGVLGYTEARLPSDNFNFIHPFDEAEPTFEFVTEVAGTRHHMEKTQNIYSIENRRVYIRPDLDNEFDENAMKVVFKERDFERKIGYINKVQAPTFKSWLSKNFV